MNESMYDKSTPCLDDKMVIAITSDQFGQGEKELSENLMKSFIYSLTEVNPRPDTLIFLNRGVFLTTEDSTVVESLRTLEAEGVEILSCGTCLNYYKMTEKLIIGTVSNMYNIVAKLNNTSNKIKI